MSSSLFSQDSVQNENVESTPKKKKNGIYHYLPLTHLFMYIYIYIYIYHTLVGPLDLMGQSSKLG